jgi:hypothetical protein
MPAAGAVSAPAGSHASRRKHSSRVVLSLGLLYCKGRAEAYAAGIVVVFTPWKGVLAAVCVYDTLKQQTLRCNR